MHKHPQKGNKMPRESLYKTMIVLKWAQNGGVIRQSEAAREYEIAYNIIHQPTHREMENYLYAIKYRIGYKYEDYMKIQNIDERFEKYKKERVELFKGGLKKPLFQQGALRILRQNGKRHPVESNSFVYDPENNDLSKDAKKKYYNERSREILKEIKSGFEKVMKDKYERYDEKAPYKIVYNEYEFDFANKRECEIKFYVQSVDDVIRIPFSIVVRKQSYELLNPFSDCIHWEYTYHTDVSFKMTANEIFNTTIKYDFRIF